MLMASDDPEQADARIARLFDIDDSQLRMMNAHLSALSRGVRS